MSNVATFDAPKKSVTLDMANKFGMEVGSFEATLRATVFPGNGTKEQFAAFLLVAKQYDLNPITKELYAFPAKGGGVVPIVSIDGWLKLINSHPQFDGMDCVDILDDKGALAAMRCTIYRKDRSHPISVTEYLSECIRGTEPWKMKNRMLRHKATIQCARYAFGFAGIYDEDEAERIISATARDVSPSRRPPAPPPAPLSIGAPAGPPAPPPASPEPPQAQQTAFNFEAFRAEIGRAENLDALNATFARLTSVAMTPEELDEADAILREVAAQFWKEG